MIDAEATGFRIPSASPSQILARMGESELRDHLVALQTVTESVLAHLALGELLPELLERLRTLLEVDTASVLLSREGGHMLTVRASVGLEEEVEQGIEIPVGQGIAGKVAARRRAVIVDDVSRVQTASPLLRRLASMMVAPLGVGDEVLGVLHVGSVQPRVFADADLYLLQVVADRVALAVKNALTYDQQRREAEELARAKDAIREREEQFRLIFERSPLPMWVFDLQTLRFLDVNEAAVRQYGWPRDEFLRMTVRDIRPPDEVPQLETALSDDQRGLVQRGRFRHRRSDGSVLEVEVTTRGIEFAGRPARIALAVDVTREREAAAERERLLEELAHQRNLLLTVTENATSALMMMDNQGRGTFWNAAAERITGYSADEALGRTLHELVHHTHPDGTPFPIEECPIDKALPFGVEVEGYEDLFIRKDGAFFPVLCAAKPILEGGRPVGTVIEVRDVTREKEAEESLRSAKEEAERASRAKTEFLSAMSHELRTPLNAIAGYVDLMEVGIHGPITDAQRQALHRVRFNQEHLLRLINDVLYYTKLEAGRLELTLVPVSVNRVLTEVAEGVEPQSLARGIAFSYQLCDPPLFVRADADRVRQILLNLADNALKFGTEGGWVLVHCSTEADRVLIHVQDNGRGIAADKLASIFDPFVQPERHRNESSRQGVGLGLAISRDLARGMGGDLLAQSEAGVGSTFTLWLPAAREDEVDPPAT